MIPWWAASFVSNIAIVGLEYFNRTNDRWLDAAPFTIPLILITQTCLYLAWNGAPHWLWAWAVFSLGNTVCRTGAVYFLASGEIGSWSLVLAGSGCMAIGALILKQGLH
jgi:hypothetical protein